MSTNQRIQIKYPYGLHVSCWPYGISHGGRGLLASHFKKPARIQVCGLSDCQWAFRGLRRVECGYCLQGQDISSRHWWMGLAGGADLQAGPERQFRSTRCVLVAEWWLVS